MSFNVWYLHDDLGEAFIFLSTKTVTMQKDCSKYKGKKCKP